MKKTTYIAIYFLYDIIILDNKNTDPEIAILIYSFYLFRRVFMNIIIKSLILLEK